MTFFSKWKCKRSYWNRDLHQHHPKAQKTWYAQSTQTAKSRKMANKSTSTRHMKKPKRWRTSRSRSSLSNSKKRGNKSKNRWSPSTNNRWRQWKQQKWPRSKLSCNNNRSSRTTSSKKRVKSAASQSFKNRNQRNPDKESNLNKLKKWTRKKLDSSKTSWKGYKSR